MKLIWSASAWEDYVNWLTSKPSTATKINDLIKDALRNTFRGLGKPEPLRNTYAGWWSRRIDGEHRLIYRVVDKSNEQALEILSCRHHYA